MSNSDASDEEEGWLPFLLILTAMTLSILYSNYYYLYYLYLDDVSLVSFFKLGKEKKAERMLSWLVGDEFARQTVLGNTVVTDYVSIAELPDAMIDPMVDIDLIKPFCQKSVFNKILECYK